MSLRKYAVCLSIAGTSVVGLRLVWTYMQGAKFSGNEQIPGKTVIVTGANTGIGKETAKELARRGGRVVLACRNLEKGEKSKAEIVLETLNYNVTVKRLDLASLGSIRAFAKDIIATEPHVDILVNNGGIYNCPKMLTEDGFEMQLGTNHMDTDVTVNSVHPGVVRTDMLRHVTGMDYLKTKVLFVPIKWLTFKSPVHGAQTTLYCALSSELEGVTGKYFSDCKETEVASQAKDDEVAKRLWAISEKWTGLA